MSSCAACGQAQPVDVVQQALDLAAVLLADGPAAEYAGHVDELAREPRASVRVLAQLVQVLARDGALADVRFLGAMHELRRVEDPR